MKNIDEFIVTCESLMINDDEITMEGISIGSKLTLYDIVHKSETSQDILKRGSIGMFKNKIDLVMAKLPNSSIIDGLNIKILSKYKDDLNRILITINVPKMDTKRTPQDISKNRKIKEFYFVKNRKKLTITSSTEFNMITFLKSNGYNIEFIESDSTNRKNIITLVRKELKKLSETGKYREWGMVTTISKYDIDNFVEGESESINIVNVDVRDSKLYKTTEDNYDNFDIGNKVFDVTKTLMMELKKVLPKGYDLEDEWDKYEGSVYLVEKY